jgi:hypothetical protein
MTAQRVVSVIGLVPVCILLYAAIQGRRKLALLSLLLAALMYLSWGVLNDAAVHGRHNLKIF